MALDGDLMASTAATNEKTMMIVVTCNEGLFNITAFNTALLMIGVPYRTSVSYDGGPYMPVPDDTHFPIEHLAFILRSSNMNVRWTLAEGTVSGKFSLRGSTAALDHVMAACAVEEPRSPSPPSR